MIAEKNLGDRLFNILNHIIMLLVMAITLYPFIYMIAISFSDVNSVIMNQVTLLPKGFNTNSYIMASQQPLFWRGYLNTVIYTIIGTAINLALTCTLAYAISRKELICRRAITFFIVITIYFQGGIISRFIVIKELGLYNTLWAIVLPFAISTYNLIIVRTFMKGIPEEIIESVRIDGGNDLQIFSRIIIPLSKSVIATIGLFYAVEHWNRYFWPMILLRDKELQPLQVILRDMIIQQNQIGYDMLMTEMEFKPTSEMIISASIIIALIPILCVYPFIQRYFVQGVMIGSLKE